MNITSPQPLNTKFMRLAYLAIASTLLLAFMYVPIGVASGTDDDDPIAASGTAVFTLETFGLFPTGNPTIFDFIQTNTDTFSGDLVGTGVLVSHGTVDFATGDFTIEGEGIFTGTIHGISGVCEYDQKGNTQDIFGAATFQYTIKFHSCTGDLDDASAKIAFDGDLADPFHLYSGTAQLPEADDEDSDSDSGSSDDDSS